jgi:hypothetical protein
MAFSLGWVRYAKRADSARQWAPNQPAIVTECCSVRSVRLPLGCLTGPALIRDTTF